MDWLLEVKDERRIRKVNEWFEKYLEERDKVEKRMIE